MKRIKLALPIVLLCCYLLTIGFSQTTKITASACPKVKGAQCLCNCIAPGGFGGIQAGSECVRRECCDGPLPPRQ